MEVALVLQGLFSFLDVFYHLFKVVTFIYNLMYLHGYRLFFMWHLGAHGGRGIYIYFIYFLYLHNCRSYFVSRLGADGGRGIYIYLFTVPT